MRKTVGDEIELIKESSTCGYASKGVAIHACSGGSNVGQMANDAANVLVGRKVSKLSCAVGQGAHTSVIVDSVKMAEAAVAQNGCSMRSVRKPMKHVDIKPRINFKITDLGFMKNNEQLRNNRSVSRW